MDEPTYDVIVAGAGTAGCALASRLSEAADKRVLLIEAGPDVRPGEEPADLLDPFPALDSNSRYVWPRVSRESAIGPVPYTQGFGVGGSSNINGMVADRGLPADYDEWRDGGAAGWGWDDVLPYFNKLEHDRDFAGPFHGKSGPIPVKRLPMAQWAPFGKAVGRALLRRGFPLLEDYNADFRDGLAPIPMNCLPERRVSASMGYLTATVRQRPNLTIVSGANVDRLVIRSDVAVGVSVRNAAGSCRIQGAEIVLACGALQSPAVLMRSGIGPGKSLREVGIPMVCDLPGVGRNLANHVAIGMVTHLPRSSMQAPQYRPWVQNVLRFSSKVEGCTEHDMLAIAVNKFAWHPLGARIGGILVEIHKPYSKGELELASDDPAAAPKVRFNLLSDDRDYERAVIALRFALELLADPEVVSVRNEVFLPNGKVVARLARRTGWNRLQARAITALFDSAPLRRRLLKKATLDVRAFLKDDAGLRHFARLAAQPVFHPCGTCRMGAADSKDTVVDANCRVLGVRGLRVVDASIFPTIPSGSLHLPVLMAAEKMADRIKSEWQHDP